ncbi:hypothetical protein FGO68_gene4509 [Halteria grandinella]|uniref:Uncharacterized protein n=1 Tax=Halteria grandinella TaxID=5974 RepID=A0A8J8T5Y5_HALGN|nr:hypothetical protein FGO68_gene4509 [Halteria grandinella]
MSKPPYTCISLLASSIIISITTALQYSLSKEQRCKMILPRFMHYYKARSHFATLRFRPSIRIDQFHCIKVA